MSFSRTSWNPGNRKKWDNWIYLKTNFKMENIFKPCTKIFKMNFGQMGEGAEKI